MVPGWRISTDAEFTVSFDLKQGSGQVQAVAGAAGTVVTLPATVPVRAGFVFLGWEYGGRLYQPGSTFTIPGQDITLVAKWKAAGVPTGKLAATGANVWVYGLAGLALLGAGMGLAAAGKKRRRK